jgi:hypothetical protein
MSSMRTQIFSDNYGYGKLLLKTLSTLSNFIVYGNGVNKDTPWAAIDEEGNIIDSGVLTIGNNIYIDLTANTGVVSVYLDVDDLGNGMNYQRYWYSNTYKVSFFDLDVLPLLNVFWMRDADNFLVKNEDSNIITNGYYYNVSFQNIDFINNNELFKVFRLYGVNSNDFILNLSNKPNIYNLYLQDKLMQLQSSNFSITNPNLQYVFLDLKNQIINYNYNFNKEILTRLWLYNHSCDYDILSLHPKLDTLKLVNVSNNNSINIATLLSNTPALTELMLDGNNLKLDEIQSISHNTLSTLYLVSDKIKELSITNTSNLRVLHLKNLALRTPLVLDAISQSKLEIINTYFLHLDELDLSDAINLVSANFNLSYIRKINLKNGQNQKLVTFNNHINYYDCCFLIDDINNPPPAFANATFRAGDVITDDQAVYDAF